MKYRKGRGRAKELKQVVQMGGSYEWLQHNGFCPNGLILEEDGTVSRPLDSRRWARAEERIAELISRIQPSRPSEKHRNAVASYVQRLVSNCVPCKVFTFGSVPLKTYLPDGDIDLTAFSEDPNLKDNWAEAVRDILQKEEKNECAQFPVKEVQYIQAEVQIIKCLVDNIVVDISFNQLGGLCTLCFLEEVDSLINNSHLFKRSIILIKAWCYYESRILGAHHGLISTYALETLVLYVFHVYNNSVVGPLEVLYRFLEFFSKFDWANFCVSLWGPVPISSLPTMAAIPPRKDGSVLLLNKMFLDACGTAYSVCRAGQENPERRFISKYLNVVDPLRLDNNLGRSVNKGNFYRIRSALGRGAQQLARILECPVEDIVPEVNQFFVNTWERHGKVCRPGVPINDVSHLRKVDTESPGKPREQNFSSQDMHHSSYSMQACTPLLFHTNMTTYAHKDLSPKQKDLEESGSQIVSGIDHYHTERNNLWKKQHDVIRRTCRMNIVTTRGHGTQHFARTCSSPELTSMSTEAASICRLNESAERVDGDANLVSGYSRTIQNSGIGENHASLRESTSCRNLASGSDQSLGSCPSKPLSGSNRSVFSSVNNLSSSVIQNYGGQDQMPVNLASYSFAPFPAVVGYSHQDHSAIVPKNSSTVESDWETIMQCPNVPFVTSYNKQFRPVEEASEPGRTLGGMRERLSLEIDHVNDDHSFWSDRNSYSVREIDPESEDLPKASYIFSPASPATSSRTKASSESSWDDKPSTVPDPLRQPMWKKTGSGNSDPAVNSKWDDDNESVDHRRNDFSDGGNSWAHLPTAECVFPSFANCHLEVNQIPGYGSAVQTMPPFGPLLVHPDLKQGVAHNHAVLPVALYPSGSPVPFVTMVPVYNMPSQAGNSGAQIDQSNTEKPTYHMTQSDSNSDSANIQNLLSHTDGYDSKNIIAVAEHSDQCGSDIFNSDFANHWKNLQYGRLCHSSQLRHPLVYHPSMVVPPVPLQATTSMVSPRRPHSFVDDVPVSAPQSRHVNPAGFSIHYRGENSTQRNGTGSYIPNPNFIKEGRCPTPRQYRSNYSHDRNEDLGDGDANWNSSLKLRFVGRAQPRNYHEKSYIKKDRSATSTSQTDRSWDTLQQNSNQFYCLSKCPSPSKPTQYDPDIVDYSVYQVQSIHSDEVSSCGKALPGLVTLYPHPPPVDFRLWSEHLRFGSVGPEHFVGIEAQEFSGYPGGCVSDLQNYQGDTGPPSPD